MEIVPKALEGHFVPETTEDALFGCVMLLTRIAGVAILDYERLKELLDARDEFVGTARKMIDRELDALTHLNGSVSDADQEREVLLRQVSPALDNIGKRLDVLVEWSHTHNLEMSETVMHCYEIVCHDSVALLRMSQLMATLKLKNLIP